MNHIVVFFALLILSYLVIYLAIKVLRLPMVIFKVLVFVSVLVALFTCLLLLTGMLEKFQFLSDIVVKVMEFVDYIAGKIKQ
ncbi:MAG: hypothetical protein A2044_00825 [Candidatus Firestonebacteria bacterium GWA2_43_8]|nr:MAG: hypothetical protein A2044_00825 [Candidatus Firestonebacteria bacterium GWA2_43_8]